MTPSRALTILRDLLVPRPGRPTASVDVPREVAEALARLGTESPAEGVDLLIALEAIDLADCSPRMLLRRRVLTSRLRLDADDAEARAQAHDLLASGRLRRRLFEVMSDAVERDDTLRALAARAVLTAADEETMGWQADALRLLEGPGAGRR